MDLEKTEESTNVAYSREREMGGEPVTASPFRDHTSATEKLITEN
ncbi:hypothetical protein GFS60_06552 (plasmid) [Rhodococcus sp. WAY2]|nr:hypothetical protein GFS60_06552 [Rhodococcus sp. WAY2]